MTLIRLLQFLTVANGLGLLVQAVRVVATYSAVYTLTTGPRRQLPLHVWLIATSYLIYVAGTTYYLYTNGNTPTGFSRAVVFLIAGVIGQYALVNVLSYERRRLTDATNFIEDDGRI